MIRPQRGEIWVADLGFAAKVRPCAVLSIPINDADRVLATIVPHTTSLHGTRFEIAIPRKFLKPGAFDAQNLITVPCGKLRHRLGQLTPAELEQIALAVKIWLGIT